MAYSGSPTAVGGPLVGGLVPFVLGPFTTATSASTGTMEIGFRCPCDLRVESVSWSAMTYPAGGGTIAIFNYTDINGAIGGTAVMAATSIAASGVVEGAGFVSSAARNFTKGQHLVVDTVITATGAAANVVITVMAYITGQAVADNTKY